MSQQLSTNTFTAATWIVNTDATKGTHTTLAGALTSASSGDTILLQSSVTENPTLKAGVNIVAFLGSELTPTVTITGKCSFSSAGTVSLSGIRLQTNSDFCLSVTGSAVSIVNLDNCYINCTNNTGISFSVSNTSAIINLYNNRGDLGTTGIKLFEHTSTGSLNIISSIFGNSGSSTTASTISAGILNFIKSNFTFPFTSSGTAAIQSEYCTWTTNALNVTALTLGGSGAQLVRFGRIASGTTSAISISSGAVILSCDINSTEASGIAITGAGIITYSGLLFSGTAQTINTTTKNGCGTLIGSKNTAPAAGFLGERISSVVASVTPGTTTTPTTITSISLTPGVWDITGYANGTTGSANLTLILVGISTATNTVQGVPGDQYYISNTNSATSYLTGSVPAYRVVINTTTTYYLIVRLDYASGSPVASGRISAVRVG